MKTNQMLGFGPRGPVSMEEYSTETVHAVRFLQMEEDLWKAYLFCQQRVLTSHMNSSPLGWRVRGFHFVDWKTEDQCLDCKRILGL